RRRLKTEAFRGKAPLASFCMRRPAVTGGRSKAVIRTSVGEGRFMPRGSCDKGPGRTLPLAHRHPPHILNYMAQYMQTRFDASFSALSDVTRRGVLEQLARSDASITDLAETFQMTL